MPCIVVHQGIGDFVDLLSIYTHVDYATSHFNADEGGCGGGGGVGSGGGCVWGRGM